jgi:hypothetical protein
MMSYSRWSNSSWYTFWNVSSGDTRDTQVLSAWYSIDKTIDWDYADAKELFENGIVDACKRIRLIYNCNEDEASELQEIFQIWMAEVRSEFP